ncbi:right-handed parallel beta-helix repeat-containing protein [Nocardiopsis sp. NPDC055551]
MHSVRVSKTDPNAYLSLSDAVTAFRIRNLTEGLYLHVEPGTYEEERPLSYPGPLMIVPTHGPETVELAVDGDRAVIETEHPLELYGMLIRSKSRDRPQIEVRGGGRLKAVDSWFVGRVPVRLRGKGESEFVDCRFVGTGLEWRGGTGRMHRCVFHQAGMSLREGAAVVADVLRFSGFEGGDVGAPTLEFSWSRARITDCVIIDGGFNETASVDYVVRATNGSVVHFTELSIEDAENKAIGILGATTRVDFTRLRVAGGFAGMYTVYVQDSERVGFTDSRIRHPKGAGMKTWKATVVVDGLTVEETKDTNLMVEDGVLEGRGLTLRHGQKGDLLNMIRSRGRLSDVELSDHHPALVRQSDGLDYLEFGAVHVSKGELELENVRAFDLDGWLLSVRGGDAVLSSVVGERLTMTAVVTQSGRARLNDVRSTQGTRLQLSVNTAGFLEVSNSHFEGSEYGLARAYGGGLTLRSTVLTGTYQEGVLVEGAGSVLLEDSEIRDCGGAGIVVRDEAGKVRLVRSTIAETGGAGIWGDRDATYEFEDSLLRDNDLNQVKGPTAEPDPEPDPSAKD